MNKSIEMLAKMPHGMKKKKCPTCGQMMDSENKKENYSEKGVEE